MAGVTLRAPQRTPTLALSLLLLLAAATTANAARDLSWWKDWRAGRDKPATLLSVAEDNDLTTLVAAIEAAPKIKAAAMHPSTAVTVLAPTNDAFAEFLALPANANLLDGSIASTQKLTNILAYHIVPTVLLSSDIPAGTGTVSTLLVDELLPFHKIGNQIFFGANNAEVVAADVEAGDSVVHVINKVLTVPEVDTIASVATAIAESGSPELNLLLAAIMRSPAVLSAVVDPTTAVTVFAPNNAAFTAFLNGAALESISEEALTEVLLYHIVATPLQSTDIMPPTTLDTLLPQRSVEVGLPFVINPGSDDAAVVTANVRAGLSLVHVIDKVLTPPALPTIASVAAGVDDLSILLEAVAAAEDILEVATDPETAVTVLAPTNAAFAAALEALGVTKEQLLSDKQLLTQILAYHIIPHPVPSSAFSSRKTIAATLLRGAFLTIQVVSGDVYIENGLVWRGDVGTDEARVVGPDVSAGRSIVHVIDQVLVPPSRPTPFGQIVRWIHGLFH